MKKDEGIEAFVFLIPYRFAINSFSVFGFKQNKAPRF